MRQKSFSTTDKSKSKIASHTVEYGFLADEYEMQRCDTTFSTPESVFANFNSDIKPHKIVEFDSYSETANNLSILEIYTTTREEKKIVENSYNTIHRLDELRTKLQFGRNESDVISEIASFFNNPENLSAEENINVFNLLKLYISSETRNFSQISQIVAGVNKRLSSLDFMLFDQGKDIVQTLISQLNTPSEKSEDQSKIRQQYDSQNLDERSRKEYFLAGSNIVQEEQSPESKEITGNKSNLDPAHTFKKKSGQIPAEWDINLQVGLSTSKKEVFHNDLGPKKTSFGPLSEIPKSKCEHLSRSERKNQITPPSNENFILINRYQEDNCQLYSVPECISTLKKRPDIKETIHCFERLPFILSRTTKRMRDRYNKSLFETVLNFEESEPNINLRKFKIIFHILHYDFHENAEFLIETLFRSSYSQRVFLIRFLYISIDFLPPIHTHTLLRKFHANFKGNGYTTGLNVTDLLVSVYVLKISEIFKDNLPLQYIVLDILYKGKGGNHGPIL